MDYWTTDLFKKNAGRLHNYFQDPTHHMDKPASISKAELVALAKQNDPSFQSDKGREFLEMLINTPVYNLIAELNTPGSPQQKEEIKLDDLKIIRDTPEAPKVKNILKMIEPLSITDKVAEHSITTGRPVQNFDILETDSGKYLFYAENGTGGRSLNGFYKARLDQSDKASYVNLDPAGINNSDLEGMDVYFDENEKRVVLGFLFRDTNLNINAFNNKNSFYFQLNGNDPNSTFFPVSNNRVELSNTYEVNGRTLYIERSNNGLPRSIHIFPSLDTVKFERQAIQSIDLEDKLSATHLIDEKMFDPRTLPQIEHLEQFNIYRALQGIILKGLARYQDTYIFVGTDALHDQYQRFFSSGPEGIQEILNPACFHDVFQISNARVISLDVSGDRIYMLMDRTISDGTEKEYFLLAGSAKDILQGRITDFKMLPVAQVEGTDFVGLSVSKDRIYLMSDSPRRDAQKKPKYQIYEFSGSKVNNFIKAGD